MKVKAIRFFSITGMHWGVPLIKILSGDDALEQLKVVWKSFVTPLLAIALFLGLWAYGASKVETSLGQVPGPAMVYEQALGLWNEHLAERTRETEFYEKQLSENEALLARDPGASISFFAYTGRPTYIDQIRTSLYTVFIGFVIASLVALPIGIVCGLSTTVMRALNPIIQILKPVSPLAWLPIVTMVVSAVYVTSDALFAKSFIISAVTVALCSLWATLINTALGVSSVNQDYVNVARVLKLSPLKKTFKIVLPATLPLIFTGLRISLGVGWMVLIAAEMLAQNPGLGKFIWDEFQNGSSQSLARIMVAVVTIGLIGFMLDRIMVGLQSLVSFEKQAKTA